VDLSPLSRQISQALVTEQTRADKDAAGVAFEYVNSNFEDLKDLSDDERLKRLKGLPESVHPSFLVTAQETFGARQASAVGVTLEGMLSSGDLTKLDAEGNGPDVEGLVEQAISEGREGLTSSFSRRGYEAEIAAIRDRVNVYATRELQKSREAFAHFSAGQELSEKMLELAETSSSSGLLAPGEGIVTADTLAPIRIYAESMKANNWQKVRGTVHDAARAAALQLADLDPEKAEELLDAFADLEINGVRMGSDASEDGDRLRALQLSLSDKADRERREAHEDRRRDIENKVRAMKDGPGSELLKATAGGREEIEAVAEQYTGKLVEEFGPEAQEEFNAMLAKTRSDLRSRDTVDPERVAQHLLAIRRGEDPDVAALETAGLNDSEIVHVLRERDEAAVLAPYRERFEPWKAFNKRQIDDPLSRDEGAFTGPIRSEISELRESARRAADDAYTAEVQELVAGGDPPDVINAKLRKWIASNGSTFTKDLRDYAKTLETGRQTFRTSLAERANGLKDSRMLIEDAYTKGFLTYPEYRQAQQDNLKVNEQAQEFASASNTILRERLGRIQNIVKSGNPELFDLSGTPSQEAQLLIESAEDNLTSRVQQRVLSEMSEWDPATRNTRYGAVVREEYQKVRQEALTEAAQVFQEAVEGGEDVKKAAAKAEVRGASEIRRDFLKKALLEEGGLERFTRDSPFLTELERQPGGDLVSPGAYESFTRYARGLQPVERLDRDLTIEANRLQDLKDLGAVERQDALESLVSLRGIPSSVLLGNREMTFDLTGTDKRAVTRLRKRLGITGDATPDQLASVAPLHKFFNAVPVTVKLGPIEDPWNTHIDFGKPVTDVPRQTITKVLNAMNFKGDTDAWIEHQNTVIAPLYR
jgi:hypothetical protein